MVTEEHGNLAGLTPSNPGCKTNNSAISTEVQSSLPFLGCCGDKLRNCVKQTAPWRAGCMWVAPGSHFECPDQNMSRFSDCQTARSHSH